MKVLIACEESQEVTKAFRERGHEAYSCDLQECSGGHPEWHFKCDVREVLYKDWDLIGAHPPCTFLANSGVRWLDIVEGKITNRERFQEMLWASQFFRLFVDVPCKKKYIENPIPHKYAGIPRYTQIVQPWMFGHGESKATCLWLYGLPELKPTEIVKEREQRIWKMAPGPQRTKLRSKTFPGIAQAIAAQWS